MKFNNGSTRRNIVYVLFVFFIWTITSFFCHYYGKAFLVLKSQQVSQDKNYQYEWQPGVYAALLLSCFQLGLCYISLDLKSKSASLQFVVAVTCHALATFATNLSMAVTFASSTFAIKLMEPITSALVQYVIVGAPLSLTSALSLPIIVGGAILFTGNPFSNAGSSIGLMAALASNVLLAFRNISFKSIQTSQKETKVLRSKCPGRQQHVIYVTLALVAVICLSLLYLELHRSIALAYLSGIFHVMYSYTSMGCALQRFSVITHAVTNICKRVFVVLLLYIVGQRSASVVNFFGLTVSTLGLLMYALDRYNTGEKVKGKTRCSMTWVVRELTCICFLASSRTTQVILQQAEEVKTPKLEFSYFNDKTNGSRRVTLILCLLVSFFLGIAFCNVIPSFQPSPDARQNVAPKEEEKIEKFDLRKFSENAPLSKAGQQFETRMFSHFGLTRPSNEMLMPRLKNISNTEADKISKFLNLDLMKNPLSANTLINQLTTNVEIIREAQRIEFNVLGKLLGKYKYAIWVGIAAFENKGDSCITSGEATLMQRLGIEVIFFCHFKSCTLEKLKEAQTLAQKYSPDEVVILNRGGGNLVGYYHNDAIRFNIINLFPDYKIVVLPQGIWVRNDDLNTWHVQKCIRKYCCSPNLTIVLRDLPSYKLAKKIFNGTTQFLLAPDSAFQFGPIPRFMNPVYDILWIKRDDLEATSNFTLPAYPSHLRVHMSQWWRWKTPIGINKIECAYYLCTNGFMYLQRAKVIITDRLHGHIVSLLSNIPHVVIDPKGRKITNFHSTWTKSFDRVAVAKTPEEAMALGIRMLDKFKDVFQPRMPFLHLREGSDQERRGDRKPQYLP